jgi:hypothetical protein
MANLSGKVPQNGIGIQVIGNRPTNPVNGCQVIS